MTLLYRQVHPGSLRRDGTIASKVLDPFRGGGREGARKRELSVYNGDLIEPGDAFKHYTTQLKLASVGVIGIDEDECRALQVDVVHDEIGYTPIVARKLRDLAVERGWMYGPG